MDELYHEAINEAINESLKEAINEAIKKADLFYGSALLLELIGIEPTTY